MVFIVCEVDQGQRGGEVVPHRETDDLNEEHRTQLEHGRPEGELDHRVDIAKLEREIPMGNRAWWVAGDRFEFCVRFRVLRDGRTLCLFCLREFTYRT